MFEHSGFCELCDRKTIFRAQQDYFRNHLLCTKCGSVPRERAIYHVLNTVVPCWRDLSIHESSPVDRSASRKIRTECPGYIASQYDRKVPFGSVVRGGAYRSEDLEAQTFENSCFDLVITQDVFEHLFRPDLAIKEIARTLKPGGAHICTVPIVRRQQASRRRAKLHPDGTVEHLLEPEYHGNPIDASGSLVTVDWGFDIAGYLAHHGDLSIAIWSLDIIDLGIRAELNEVLVCWKRASTPESTFAL